MEKLGIFIYLWVICSNFLNSDALSGCVDRKHNVVVSKAAIPKPRRVWFKPVVTYAFIGYAQDVPPVETEEAIKNAFAQWSSVIPLTFRDVTKTEEKPDISFIFSSSICRVYAFTIPGSRTVFNTNTRWAYRDTSKILSREYLDLNSIALHEIGHHLGIPDDSGRPGSIMHMHFRRPQTDNFGNYLRPLLQPDDIENAQALYGLVKKT
uniref:Peptidase metallopeptidase domain-containing protein n=1 Tax=Acrobeloides nanus TaxID=290746 RepID=A0A914EPX5_9BILA